MPEAPTAYQSWGWRSAASSRRVEAVRSPGMLGTKARISTTVTALMTPTATKAARQPRCWPSSVAAGTPRTLATGMPIITSASALPRRSGATMPAAVSAATPK